MKRIRLLVLCLLICILSLVEVVGYALQVGDCIVDMTQYGGYAATIKKITPSSTQQGSYMLSTVNNMGEEADIILFSDTYIVDNVKFKEGDAIIIFYDTTKLTTMNFPSQYFAEVAALRPIDQLVYYDIFDEDLMNSNSTLKLSISKDTPIFSKDGTVYKGELKNQKLVVFYTESTKGIPHVTHPNKVIVVSEESKQDSTPERMGSIQFILNKILGIDIKDR